jgi:hypothetical protein
MIYPFLPATSEKIQAVFGTGVVQPLEAVLFPKIKLDSPEVEAAPVVSPPTPIPEAQPSDVSAG